MIVIQVNNKKIFNLLKKVFSNDKKNIDFKVTNKKCYILLKNPKKYSKIVLGALGLGVPDEQEISIRDILGIQVDERTKKKRVVRNKNTSFRKQKVKGSGRSNSNKER